MKADGVAFKDKRSGPLMLGDDEAWSVARELNAEGKIIHQETVVLMKPTVVVVATATTDLAEARASSAVIAEVLGSLRFA